MALLTISGEPASRWEEVAHGAAQLLKFELVTEARLTQWTTEEFGDAQIPDRAWGAAVVSILARMAVEHHVVVALPGSEALFGAMPMLLRAGIVAPEARRVGNVMLEERLERAEAKALLAERDREWRALLRRRFARAKMSADCFDVTLNAEHTDVSQMAEVIRAAACARGLAEQGLLSAGAEAQMQFQTRLQLAKHGIVPAGRANLKRAAFGHPSEELFANLLDFYRIQWQYEPRSFPLQWDKDGNVTEAFTPDFYLPEFDLYVELTTMKQANVTKKNRKVKLLRAIYPHINIQVFYQKDFQDLVFKYGLNATARN
ncbi:MAG: cytidylate kinase family protein [Acidobacteriia bacterium]|nr:cytidylate kinase family protein [Terriglobia bacterium]